jgi:hypothetical protein
MRPGGSARAKSPAAAVGELPLKEAVDLSTGVFAQSS